MAVITLTTDWRNYDYYVGAVKGKILSRDSSTNIVDISHQISAFSIMQAAFVVRNCYREFPENTVHIIGVNSMLNRKQSLLITEKSGHYFLSANNGFPDLIFPAEPKNVYQFKVENEAAVGYVGLNIFIEVAFRIINGENPEAFAQAIGDYRKQIPILPAIDTNLINGSIVYIDSFSNAITNINREIFERVGGGNSFDIFVQSNHNKISEISNSYTDLPAGELIALFNSTGLLEIAITNGPAAELLNLSINSVVRVKFLNKKNTNQLLLSGE